MVSSLFALSGIGMSIAGAVLAKRLRDQDDAQIMDPQQSSDQDQRQLQLRTASILLIFGVGSFLAGMVMLLNSRMVSNMMSSEMPEATTTAIARLESRTCQRDSDCGEWFIPSETTQRYKKIPHYDRTNDRWVYMKVKLAPRDVRSSGHNIQAKCCPSGTRAEGKCRMNLDKCKSVGMERTVRRRDVHDYELSQIRQRYNLPDSPSQRDEYHIIPRLEDDWEFTPSSRLDESTKGYKINI